MSHDSGHRDRAPDGSPTRAALAPACVCACTALLLALACGGDAGGSLDGPNAPPSGPVDPVPANLWQPPTGSTPATGSYAYLEMDAGFSPGVAYPHTIVALPGAFTVSATEGRLTVVAVDSARGYAMNAVFQTMIGLTQLEEGYYADVRGLTQSDPLRGAMRVALSSRECDAFAGWFAIDHVFYFSGILTALDMRFEERCPGFGAPMHGQIHWRE